MANIREAFKKDMAEFNKRASEPSQEEPTTIYTCVVCGEETNTPKTLMDRGLHRYVCGSNCMRRFYSYCDGT